MFSPTAYQPARLPAVLTGTLLCLIVLLSSCTPMPVSEARHIVAEADSLRSAGFIYDDSLRLAGACSVLGRWHNRLLHPDDCVRSCYHYGRLLRSNGDCGCSTNYIAAMQTFISGTHAQYLCRPVPNPLFSDHATLARIYSNMGAMCHLVDSFQLSYCMYEKCSEQFKRANDNMMYYYAVNTMALQLAEQKKHDETFALLNKIENECADSNVIAKVWETKVFLYYNLQQYDSAIYSVNQLQAYGNCDATGFVKKAQAFWFVQQYDSALYYAKHIITLPDASSQDRYNMLYILAYNDSAINADEIRELTEERVDINIEVLTPLLQQLTLAADILKQDVERGPHYMYPLFLLFTVCLTGCLLWYVRRRHKQLKIETAVEQKKTALLQKKQRLIIQENSKIAEETISLRQQQEALFDMRIKKLEDNCHTLSLSHNMLNDLHWKNSEELYETVNTLFCQLANKLKAIGSLNEKEIRLCILVLIGNMKDKEIADILCYSDKTIRGTKRKVAIKLGTTSAGLRNFLLNKAAE